MVPKIGLLPETAFCGWFDSKVAIFMDCQKGAIFVDTKMMKEPKVLSGQEDRHATKTDGATYVAPFLSWRTLLFKACLDMPNNLAAML